jgi:hypothetical protein
MHNNLFKQLQQIIMLLGKEIHCKTKVIPSQHHLWNQKEKREEKKEEAKQCT